MPRPTKKVISLALGALVLFGVGANAQAGWLYVIGASFVGVLAAGLIMPRGVIKGLEVGRRGPQFAQVGDEIDMVLTVTNPSHARMAFGGTDSFVTKAGFAVRSIQARSSLELPLKLKVERRGVHSSGRVELYSGAPFGVAVARRDLQVQTRLVVHPVWHQIPSFPMLESASAPNEALHDRSRRGAGLDFYGLRDYRPGDSPRTIHWASTAKGGRLLVREFEEQLASRVTILIDGSRSVGEEPHTTFEASVTAAASIALYSLDVGHPVQLFADSRGGLKHLYEPTKLQTMDWLAEVEADGRRSLARTAEAMLPEVFRRSTVVIIFPSTSSSSGDALTAVGIMQQAGARVVAVVVSARGFGGGRDVLGIEQEAKLVSDLGVHRAIVYRIDGQMEIGACLRQPLLV